MLFRSNKKILLNGFGYVLASAGCIYSHYFSFMMAGIMGFTGLFFVKKEGARFFIFCNIIPLLLFIPSIPIFRQQFGYKGIGGWLPPPDGSFLPRYLFYGFNESWMLVFFFSGLLLGQALLKSPLRNWKKFHTISLTWYMLPFLTGYLYSVYISPVLQYSTLLFSFPFIIIFLFSFFRDDLPAGKMAAGIILLTFSVTVYSTVWEKKY